MIHQDENIIWKKNCPKCGCEQFYTRKSMLNRSILLNKQCRKCMFDSDEYKQKHVVNSKNMWASDTKRNEIVKKRNTPEAKQKWHNSVLVSMNTDAYKEKQSILQKELLNLYPERVEFNKQSIKQMWNDKSSVYHTAEFREKLRLARIKQMKKLGVTTSNFNPKACEFIDKLNKEKGWNLQHALNGGEIVISGYYLDGYDRDRNIVFEYDERYHYKFGRKLRNKDTLRQQRIINKLTPTQFFRYDEEKQNLYEVIVRKEK